MQVARELTDLGFEIVATRGTARAIAAHGVPEIFNTDQGSQFTSLAFTGLLQDQQIAISMDGRAIPEYPNARPDNGMAARLNATAVPALYLTAPATRQIVPVGFGVMSMTDLVERIAALAQDAPAGNRQP